MPLRLTEQGVPATPAAGDHVLYWDSADKRLKILDQNGLVIVLESVDWPKNHLINGGFNFANRQVAGTLTTYSQTAARAYCADRWGLSNENLSVQYQQIDTGSVFETGQLHRYYGRIKKITGAGKVMLSQVIEGENSMVLRGRRVRLMFSSKRTVAAAMTIRIGLAQLTAAGTIDVIPGWAAGVPSGTFVSAWGGVGTDPTLGTNVTRLTPVANTADGGTISGDGLSCVLSGTMSRYSVCFDVPTTIKNLVAMIWSDGQLAAADELNISQAMLTDGPDIVDWVSMPAAHDSIQCLRFYVKTFPSLVLPAQNVGNRIGCAVGHCPAGAVAAQMGWRFPVSMRAIPTLVYFNPAAANGFVRNIALATDASVTATGVASEHAVEINMTGAAGWLAGQPVAVHATADAEI